MFSLNNVYSFGYISILYNGYPWDKKNKCYVLVVKFSTLSITVFNTIDSYNTLQLHFCMRLCGWTFSVLYCMDAIPQPPTASLNLALLSKHNL